MTGPNPESNRTGSPETQRRLIIGGVVGLLLLGLGVLWGAGVFQRGDGQQQTAEAETPGPAAGEPETLASAAGGAQRRSARAAQPPGPIEPLDLTWLPPDVEMLISLRPADIWNAPLVQQLADSARLQQFADEMFEQTGHRPDDVESILIGVTNWAELAQAAPDAATATAFGAEPQPSRVEPDGLLVVRSRVPLNRQKLAALGHGEERDHQGTVYYRITGANANADANADDADDAAAPDADSAASENSSKMTLALYFPDDLTALVGPEEQIQAAIAAGPQSVAAPRFAFADAAQHCLFAFAPHDPAVFSREPEAGVSDFPAAAKLLEAAQQDLVGGGLGLRIDGGVHLQLVAQAGDAAGASSIASALDELVADLHNKWAAGKAELPFPPAVATLVDGVLEQTGTFVQEETAGMSFSISESMIADFRRTAPPPEELLGMMFGLMLRASFDAEEAPLDQDDVPAEAPQELQVSAVARRPDDLQLWIYIVGEEVQHATAWGQVKLETAVTDAGETLDLRRQEYQSRFGVTQTFKTIDDNRSGHPRFGVRAELPFAQPDQPVAELAHVKGSVKLQVPGERKEILLKDAAKLDGKPIDHPDLKRAGVELTGKTRNQSIELTLTQGESSPVAAIEPVDAQGQPLSTGMSSRSGSGEKTEYHFGFFGEIPRDLQLKVRLNLDVQEMEVPFEFHNVRVPLPADAPGRPPASTDGMPAGLELASKTRWQRGSFTIGNRPVPPPLEVELNLQGPPAEQAIAWRGVIRDARAPGGVPWEPHGGFQPPSQASFHRLDWENFSQEPAGQGVRAVMQLPHPLEPAAAIELLQGTLQLQVAGETKEVVLEKFPSLVDKPIRHPTLDQAGVRLTLTHRDDEYRLTIAEGDPLAVGDVTLVDAAGEPLRHSSIFRINFGGSTYYQISTFFREPPADAGLKFKVHHNLQQLEVPFRFENLPVPDPPVR